MAVCEECLRLAEPTENLTGSRVDPLLELRVDCQCIQGLDEGHLVGGKGGEFGLHWVGKQQRYRQLNLTLVVRLKFSQNNSANKG